MRVRTWSVLVVVVLAAAACRGATEPEAESGDGDATASTAAEYPRTVESLAGDVTIEEQPTRVVTLGFSLTDVVLGLGVTPVGAFTNSKDAPFGTHVPLQAYEDEIDSIGFFEINLEEIAALQPDLIVGLSWIEGFKGYDEMTKIAPVVVLDPEANWTTWVEDVGYAMGLEGEAAEVVEAYEARAAEVAAAIPDGTEVALVEPGDDGSATVDGPDSSSGSLATDAGLDVLTIEEGAIDWQGKRGGKIVWTELSKERLEEITSPAMLVLTFQDGQFEAIEDDPLWNGLPAFENEQVFVEEGGEAWFQTGPLGAMYALDQIERYFGQ